MTERLGGEDGRTFFVTWEAPAATAIPFTLSYTDIPSGDVIGYPLAAVAGNNAIAGKGTGIKFYTYTATRDGKLTVEVKNKMTVAFPSGTDAYAKDREMVNNGNKYYLEATEGTLYYIRLEGVEDGDSFTITEEDFAAGESRQTAVEFTGNTYVVNNAPVNSYWIKYKVQKPACKLIIEGTMLYEANSAMSYVKGSEYWTTDMKVNEFDPSVGASVYKFKATTKAVQGDEFLVCYSMPNAGQNGKEIRFTELDYDLGEDLSTAIPLNVGKVSILDASVDHPVWLKVTLKEGDFRIGWCRVSITQVLCIQVKRMPGLAGESVLVSRVRK